MRERFRNPPPRVLDVALALTQAVLMALIVSVAEEEDARSVNALGYLIALSLGPLLLARRRHPILVLTASIGALFIYYGLDFPAFSPALPLAAAVYSAAAAGRLVPAAALATLPVLAGVGWRNIGEGDSLLSVVGTQTLADAALLAAFLLLGEAVRNRRAWSAEVRDRLERAERDREREAARRVEQERLRIARELHDVVAHTIAVVNVQAGVAADLLADAPEAVQAPLRTIRTQSREALAELKAAVGLLREGDTAEPPRAPTPGLAALDTLVAKAGGAGLAVEVSVSGRARPLPGAVDVTAYRIVQESLTNVVRHAEASAARVEVRFDPAAVEVSVEDNGRGTSEGTDGFGLLGMRERAAAIGGTLHAGPGSGGGFRVDAHLPIPDGQA